MTQRRVNVTIDGDTASLAVADFRALLSPREQRALEAFEARCGVFGDVERRTVPFTVERTADAPPEPSDAAFTVRGHAAVYNRKSLDLGGFQEVVATAAFQDVLDRDPDVHLNWDHDMRFALARTRSSKYLLELREDPKGLHYYARVAPTSFAADLRVLMEGGVIDQASFAFTVDEDIWEVKNRDKPDEYVLRTIVKVGDLYDVTITAQGAYPQTDSQVVRAYAVAFAQANGRLDPDLPDEGEPEERGASEDVAPDSPEGVEENAVAQVAGSEADQEHEPTPDELRAQARADLLDAKTRYLRIDRRVRDVSDSHYQSDRGGTAGAR